MNFCVIGNGLDLSLGLNTRFSDFRESEIGLDFREMFKKILTENSIIVHMEELVDRTGVVEEYRDDLDTLLKENLNWNRVEQILGYTWEIDGNINRDDIDFIGQLHGIKFKIYAAMDDIEYFRTIFILVFEQYFTKYLKNIEGNKKYDFLYDGINKTDIIINLNYTNTLSEAHNLHKVHVYVGDDNYNIIGSTDDKAFNKRIADNLELIEEQETNKLIIYGWHMHDEIGIVDLHIVEKLQKLNPKEVKYINYKLSNSNIMQIKKIVSELFGSTNLEIIDKQYQQNDNLYSRRYSTSPLIVEPNHGQTLSEIIF